MRTTTHLIFQRAWLFPLVLITALAWPLASSAQLDGLLRKTTRKLGNELERMAVEKLSDIIARKAAEKMESAFDKMLADAIEQDSTYQPDDSAYYRAGQSYAMFLQGMNDAANLPESYHFDLNILMEIATDGDKPENVRMYYSKSEPIFAMQTATSEKESQIMLMDVGNDVTVLYAIDGDKKTAQALPNMMKLAGSMGQQQVEEDFNYTITPIRKKQKVAGYVCEGYEGTFEEERFETWLTDQLGVSWHNAQGMLISQFAPNAYNDELKAVQGIPLKSLSYDKKGKLQSSMEAKEVDLSPFELKNADYTFGNMK